MMSLMIRDETARELPPGALPPPGEETRVTGPVHDLASQGMLWLGQRSLDPLDALRRGHAGRKP